MVGRERGEVRDVVGSVVFGRRHGLDHFGRFDVADFRFLVESCRRQRILPLIGTDLVVAKERAVGRNGDMFIGGLIACLDPGVRRNRNRGGLVSFRRRLVRGLGALPDYLVRNLADRRVVLLAGLGHRPVHDVGRGLHVHTRRDIGAGVIDGCVARLRDVVARLTSRHLGVLIRHMLVGVDDFFGVGVLLRE